MSEEISKILLPKVRREFPELIAIEIPAPVYTKPHEPIDYSKVDPRSGIAKWAGVLSLSGNTGGKAMLIEAATTWENESK